MHVSHSQGPVHRYSRRFDFTIILLNLCICMTSPSRGRASGGSSYGGIATREPPAYMYSPRIAGIMAMIPQLRQTDEARAL